MIEKIQKYPRLSMLLGVALGFGLSQLTMPGPEVVFVDRLMTPREMAQFHDRVYANRARNSMVTYARTQEAHQRRAEREAAQRAGQCARDVNYC